MSGNDLKSRKFDVRSADTGLAYACKIALLQLLGPQMPMDEYESLVKHAAASMHFDLYVTPTTSQIKFNGYKMIVTHSAGSHAMVRQIIIEDDFTRNVPNPHVFGKSDSGINLFWQLVGNDNKWCLFKIHQFLTKTFNSYVAGQAAMDLKEIPIILEPEPGGFTLTYHFDQSYSNHPVVSASFYFRVDEDFMCTVAKELTVITTNGLHIVDLLAD